MKVALRYLLRALAVLLALIVALAAGLTIYMRTASFNLLLERKANDALAGQFRGQLTIGAIQASRIGRVDLHDLAIAYQGRDLLHVPLAEVGYALVPLLWHQVHLAITVQSPIVHLACEANGQWDLAEALQSTKPSASSGPSAYSVMLNALVLSNGTIEVAPQGHSGPHYRISAANLDAWVEVLRSGVKLDARQFSAHLEAPNAPPADVTLAASYDASSRPATIELSSLRLATKVSSLSGTATVRNPLSPDIDAHVMILRLAPSDLSWIHGYPLRDDIAGSISLNGPVNALHAAIALTAGPARMTLAADADITHKEPTYNGTLTLAHLDLGRLVLGIKLAGLLDASAQVQGTGTQPATLAATIKATGHALVVNNILAGNVDLTAASKHDNAQIAGALASGPSRITYDASIANFTSPRVQARIVTRHLDLQTMLGSHKQPRSDINAALTLDTVINPAKLDLAQIDARTMLGLARTSVQNVVINSASVDARLHSGVVNLAQMAVTARGATLNARGTVGIIPHTATRLAYAMRAQRLAPLLQIAQIKGDGELDLTGTANGSLLGADAPGLRVQGRATGINVNFNGTTVANTVVIYDLSRIGKGGLPFGSAQIQLANVASGATRLRSMYTDAHIARQQPVAATLALKVVDAQGHTHSAAANLVAHNSNVNGTLAEISVVAPDGTWQLVSPAHFIAGARAISIANFQVRNGSRELALKGTMRIAGPQDVTFTARNLDLGLIKPLLQPNQNPAGTITADVAITGTAAAPIVHASLAGQGLAMDAQRIGDLTLRADYAPGATNVNLALYQDPLHQMTLTGTVPMNLDWVRGFHAYIGNDAALKLYSAGLRLGGIAALAPPRTIKDATGQLAFDLAINGPPFHPAVNGTIAVDNASGQIIPLGININHAFVHTRMTPELFTLEQLELNSGDGSITGSGTVALTNYTPGAINLGITLNQWPAINNERYQATIGSELHVSGTPSAPNVTGRVDVLNATIHPDLAFLTATRYSRDDTIVVIRPGEDNPPPPPTPNANGYQGNGNAAANAGAASRLFDNLAINVAVVVHRGSWIRHPDTSVELAGHLRIVKLKQGPLTIVGEIDTMRGWIVFNSQTFNLASGQILFTGGRTIDPSLNIDAQYTVSDYTIDVIVTGFASKPVLKLRSQPPLPQADILSLLIFGKTTSSLGQRQSSSLQQQAAKMAAGAAASTIGQALSSSLGLESLGIDLNGSAGNGGVAFGRYIGKNTYVSAAQSTTGGQGRKVSIQYYIKRWLSIMTSTDSNGSSQIFLNLMHQY